MTLFQMKGENMTNGHVTQNLDLYLKRSEPDYAILLRGSGVVGKHTSSTSTLNIVPAKVSHS